MGTQWGTAYFVSLPAACRYYLPYGFSPRDVDEKIKAGEIHIGQPEVKPGQKLVIVDEGTRYAIEDVEPLPWMNREQLDNFLGAERIPTLPQAPLLPGPNPTPKVRMVCRECGSDHVVADAYAAWNIEKQVWEVDNVFDKGAHCDNCDGECRIDEEEITDDDPERCPGCGRTEVDCSESPCADKLEIIAEQEAELSADDFDEDAAEDRRKGLD